MITIRKHPLTLIEVSIAFGIVAIIMFILFSCFKNSVLLTKKVENVKPQVIKEQIVYQRLIQVFSFTDPETINIQKVEGCSSKALIFSFENGVDPSLTYSGMIKAKLFLNHDHNLIFEMWPAKGEGAHKEEILFSNVDELTWDLSTKDILVMKVQETSYAFFLPKTIEKGYSIHKERSK